MGSRSWDITRCRRRDRSLVVRSVLRLLGGLALFAAWVAMLAMSSSVQGDAESLAIVGANLCLTLMAIWAGQMGRSTPPKKWRPTVQRVFGVFGGLLVVASVPLAFVDTFASVMACVNGAVGLFMGVANIPLRHD